MPLALALIGWALAIFIGTFTVRNFWRSHFPHLDFGRPAMETQIDHDGKVEQYLCLDVFSQGADIYGLKVLLEAVYPQHNDPTRLGEAPFRFVPISPIRDPLRKGQHVRFRLAHEGLKNWHYNPKDKSQRLQLTKLQPGSVKIVAYQSGNRRIAELLAGDFEQALEKFDDAPEVSVEKRGDETVISMRYARGRTVKITDSDTTTSVSETPG